MHSEASVTDLDIAALPPSLRQLAARGLVRNYGRGAVLIEEGSQGDSLYLVLSGSLRVYGCDARGREVTYGIYGSGEYVGEMSLDGGLRSASVITEEASRCVMLTRASLLAHIAAHPEFAFELLTKVIRRARAATLSTKQLALNDVYGRLRALLESSSTAGDDIMLTHQAMAHRLGCSREMVSKLVKDLEQGGYLTRIANGRYQRLRALPIRW
ncbi:MULTISPECIES: Crp/Fnr family transcriptional regulator [Roseateles]|uniref:Crp/Fnr family transcriptional regulator n=1 Tax=Roseateles albus TaxID=2987525 RepID=A0ABT5KDV4_9BURK|nr:MULTISPECIES: Crp/Fnr family transcriptional regulator [Roseateles]MCV2358559.1 Crp/Fnr family transcriptional regulator [Paucibacter sp. TC2R-5]MDC8772108.1 Crp/Fnr family transcriptional regulator [Roseateles albus]